MVLKKSIYFIGIGGIGMSALARYFKAQKWAVSGSDMVGSNLTKNLQKEGISVKIGHKKGHIRPGLALIVYNQAIIPDNSELKEAKRLGIPCRSYPQVVGDLTRQYRTIAITGAHGKSTTTALVGLILKKAGFDPTIIVGAELKELGGKNFRLGRGKYLVLEADEFGRAFLHYSPALAIVTNVDREHLDVYQSLAGVQKGFLKFIGEIKIGGMAVLNRDSEPLFVLKSKISVIAKKRNIKVIWYSFRDPAAKKIKRIIKIPGAHNVSNAIAAYRLATFLKIPESEILRAIGSFRGSSRRFEYRGKLKSAVGGQRPNILVYDDYAHHPTEIKATIRAFREKYPGSELVCVFQPHQAKRLKALFGEFLTAFNGAKKTLILPIYKVAGRDEHYVGYDSEALVRTIQKKQPRKLIFYLKDPKNLEAALKTLVAGGHTLSPAVVVMMGAGDIVNYTDLLLT
jgi:UDP-N-acetylmuramate--alanine ligase